VNWIESKALFADERLHEQYMRDQLRSYKHRYGPGIVIYWFGFVKCEEEEGILVMDSFPKSIVKMQMKK